MSKIFNFSAGPAALPAEVMQRVQKEFLNCNQSGLSVVEMSHRSDEFQDIARRAEKDLRELLSVPESHEILFLQGGATTQFAMAPINLLRNKNTADYFHTGYWSGKAIKEAKRFCEVNLAVNGEPSNFTDIPAPQDWHLNTDAAYVHYTSNETIGGVEFHEIPEIGGVPLIADMSSNLLTRPIDVSRFALIYAGAQKNIGPSGLAIVIIDRKQLGYAAGATPSMLDYKLHFEADSMYNTPATFPWYVSGLEFDWVKTQGGLQAMEQINIRKSEKLYAAIDNSDFYSNPVAKNCRSRMNLPFMLGSDALNDKFLSEAHEAGLVNLQGHRSVGGMRASIYNAMPEEGVDTLISFMQVFERTHG